MRPSANRISEPSSSSLGRSVGRAFRPRALLRQARRGFIGALILSLVSAGLPVSEILPAFPKPAVAAGEVVASPRMVSPAVMPNGQVGILFFNLTGTAAELRFKRYGAEWGLDPSVVLSTASEHSKYWHTQLVTFKNRLIAMYVDPNAPNAGKLAFRVSDDNGVTWATNAYPFGTETFDTQFFVPRLVSSRDGQTLYLFTVINNNTIPRAPGAAERAHLSTAAGLAEAGG
jgi:hypothetical protein